MFSACHSEKAFSLLKTSVIIILTQLAGRPRFDAVLLKFYMADTSSGGTPSVDVSSVYREVEGFTVEVDLPSKLSLTGHFARKTLKYFCDSSSPEKCPSLLKLHPNASLQKCLVFMRYRPVAVEPLVAICFSVCTCSYAVP